MESDDFYVEFADWCRAEGNAKTEEDVPSLWRRFTPEAMDMFGKILAVDGAQRCTEGEVKAYVEKDWLKTVEGTDQQLSEQQ